MSTNLLKVAADFETTLAQQVSVGDETATILEDNDIILVSGTYGFTIDGDNQYKEFIIADVVDTALTNIKSITAQGDTSVGFSTYHRRGASVVMTDWAVLQRLVGVLSGAIAIDANTPLFYGSAPALGSANQLATVQYVLDTVNGGPVSFDAIVVSGTAGENISEGDWVYLEEQGNDGHWFLTDATDTAKSVGVRIGKALGSATSGNAISAGIFTAGLEATGSYSSGHAYYLSDTPGEVTTDAEQTNVVQVGFADLGARLLVQAPTQQASSQVLPGTVIAFAGESVFGYLPCDGSPVLRASYPALFLAIGTTWGAGNGSTTFNVPNLNSRTLVGSSQGTKVATFASRASNIITVTGLDNAANNEFQTGAAVTYHTTGTEITGLLNDTVYYVIRVSNTTFSLASTLANAQNATVISLSGDGTGTQTFTLTFTDRELGQTGGEENHAMSLTQLLSHAHSLTTYTGGAVPSHIETFGGNGSPVTINAGDLAATGGNVAMNVMNPFAVIGWFIKI